MRETIAPVILIALAFGAGLAIFVDANLIALLAIAVAVGYWLTDRDDDLP